MIQMTIVSGKQSLGQRENQEDAFDVVFQNERDPKSDILMLVADGMGGHAGGEVASNLALSVFKSYFVEGSEAPRPRERLQESLTAANEALREKIIRRPDLKGMGCTLVAALKFYDRLVWVSVGDSSLLLLREGRLRKLNADHSLYGELLQMVAAGQITRQEANNHPRHNALRSALMGDRISLTDVNAIDLKPGDVVLVCSDGLDTLSQEEISDVLQNDSNRDMRGVASDLLNAVEAKGKPKQDNTTVVVYAHEQDGMSSMLRGTQWGLNPAKSRKNKLKYVAIGLGAFTVGVAVGALSFSGKKTDGTDPATAPEIAPPTQEERSIKEGPVCDPVETELTPSDEHFTVPEDSEIRDSTDEPNTSGEEITPTDAPNQSDNPANIATE